MPESAVSIPQPHHYELAFSGQLVKVVLIVVAGMLFQPSILVIHDGFCFFVSDLPLLSIQFPPSFVDVAVCWDPLEHCLSGGILQYRHGTGKDIDFLVLGVG